MVADCFVSSAIMKYDDTDLEPSLRRWLGDRVRDEELSEHMRTRRRGFIIGELLDDERQEPQGRFFFASSH